MFAEVTASTIVIRLRRQAPDDEWLAKIRHGLDDDNVKKVKQADWRANGGIIDIFSDDTDRHILEGLESGATPLQEFCHRIRFGVVISGNLSEVVRTKKSGDRWKPFLEGDEIGAYSINYRGRYLNYTIAVASRSNS